MSSMTTAPSTVPTFRRGDLAPEDVDALRSGFISAWDIETSGLDFRTERIGTVQIADENGNTWVVQVDPEKRPDALCYLLTEASTRKLFHFAPFDLTFMRFHWGVRSQNVACTKVLSRLVHPESESHSLKVIVQRELGIALPKSPTVRQSDWTADELTAEQVSYAVSDVLHLVALYDVLMEKATRHGVSRLAERAFEYLPSRVETELLGLEDIFAY